MFFLGLGAGMILVIVPGVLLYFLKLKKSPEIDLTHVKWQRSADCVNQVTYRNLKRNYPTHDLVTGVLFCDLVTTKGQQAQQVMQKCRDWLVAGVMIDKRTGFLDRVIIWNDDDLIEEKNKILKKVGYRTVVLDREENEEDLILKIAV
jgi:hypothetical protein